MSENWINSWSHFPLVQNRQKERLTYSERDNPRSVADTSISHYPLTYRGTLRPISEPKTKSILAKPV